MSVSAGSIGDYAFDAAPFSIPATTSLQERRPRTLKHGDTFGIFDPNGDALSSLGRPDGLFHRDTRHLSHFHLAINGARPILLTSTLRDDNATLTCDITNPDLYDAAGRLILEHDLIHMRRSRFLWNATCFERLAIRNFGATSHTIRIEIGFAADFADLFEVRGAHRARRGRLHPPEIANGRVTLAYGGLDGVERQTSIRFDPAPQTLLADRAQFRFELAPGASEVLFIEIGCENVPRPQQRRAFFLALRDARRALRKSSSRAAAMVTSNETFNEAMRRCISDLYMLTTDTEHGPYPYAGIPWFSTVFGRDALITSLLTLWIDPAIARGVLRYLAANQATEIDAAADAEPGKILHEIRKGEMALLGEVPFRRYYGSVDSTPLFVMLAGAYLARTGDLDTIRSIWPNIEAALGWLQDYGDRDGDGFIEYGRRTADGLINQGWKDSHDSVFHADGSLARGPIALVEVQAYAYGAWSAAAAMARALELPSKATRWRKLARGLRKRFDAAFFDEQLGCYVLALDGEKAPCRVRASNAGHALYTGIAYPERAEAIQRTLMGSTFYSGWGVRTVAATEARYNPMSYHNGSVWPHDNAIIAGGLANYGYRRATARIFEGLFAASTYIDLRRLPELLCGFSRQRGQGPTFYPVACAPQAWASATPPSLLQACLGLGFAPGAERLTFELPVLPGFLDEVMLYRIELGAGSVDVCLRSSGREVVATVLERRGNIRVVTTS